MKPTSITYSGQSHYRVMGLLLASALSVVSFHTRAAEPELPPLPTISQGSRLPGKFVWADLVTDDVAAARTFYAKLFGWTFQDRGGYVIAANDERPLCGLFQRSRPADKSQAKPRWFGYISVANVNKAQRAVTKAGGRVIAGARKLPRGLPFERFNLVLPGMPQPLPILAPWVGMTITAWPI